MKHVILDLGYKIIISVLKEDYILYIENGSWERKLICPTKVAAQEIAEYLNEYECVQTIVCDA